MRYSECKEQKLGIVCERIKLTTTVSSGRWQNALRLGKGVVGHFE